MRGAACSVCDGWRLTLGTRTATLNLNGDYLSDALAAQVGGIGIAPGVSLLVPSRCRAGAHLALQRLQGNINYKTGHAIFEATHGTAPK